MKSLAILGSTFLFLSPRIFAQSFYNNKDIVFMSLFVISLYTAINFLEKPNVKNAIIFSIISSLAIDIRILADFSFLNLLNKYLLGRKL